MIDQFSRLTSMALACDLTRVVTLVTQNIPAEEFGAAPGTDVHQDIAHASTPESGSDYRVSAENAMTDYNRVYAEHFAYLLDQLAAVPENGGTLLDHTAVVWLTELGTGGGEHALHRVANVIAGGGNGYFRTGRYVHYGQAQTIPEPYGGSIGVGPGQARMYVSLMHAMGMTSEDSVGLREVNIGGSRIPLTGPLPNLA